MHVCLSVYVWLSVFICINDSTRFIEITHREIDGRGIHVANYTGHNLGPILSKTTDLCENACAHLTYIQCLVLMNKLPLGFRRKVSSVSFS